MNKLFQLIITVNILMPMMDYAQTQPIGQWREHLEFGPSQQVVFAADKFFVASKWGIYSMTYDDRIIERYSKVNGLNDLGVKTIQYNAASEKLLIAYNNSNLDLLYRNDIINIPYIKRSDIIGDKSIYQIFMEGNRAYLSTGLGVIVVNLDKYEIQSTWPVGNNSRPAKVNAFSTDQDFFYAATNQGLKRIRRTDQFPENFARWEVLSGKDGLPSGETRGVFTIKNDEFVQFENRLFKRATSGEWAEVYRDDWQWMQASVSDDMIHICQNAPWNNQKRVVQWDPAQNKVTQILEKNDLFIFPMDAKSHKNKIYVADMISGTIIKDGDQYEQVTINSPFGRLDGEMIFQNNKLYVAGGSINSAWNYLYNGSGFFTFSNNEWKNFSRKNLPWMDTLLDIITIAVDPADQTIYAGSYSGGIGRPGGIVLNGGGLIEYKGPNNYKIYKQDSPIEKIEGDNSYRIGGLALDNERNLWVSNFGGASNIDVKKADGKWVQFSAPFSAIGKRAGQILIDDFNQKWIQVPQNSGIICFNHGASIDNPNDDQWKWLRMGRGNGNLPDDEVNTIAKDKDGFIWIGTDKGIGIIQCPGEVFSSASCEAFQPVVQQDNFAGLLFANESVRAIAVDGANRKWVGTGNGVWLISPDGEKVIKRFTEENSPLLSNEIIRIAIDPNSGEVYFSTFNGICSYRSTATEGKEQHDNILVFPNPVPSGYNGQIGIRGLAANSFVKITEITGRLVYQTRALGGQAVWNGRDYNGNSVATGVYLVLVTDETGIEKTAGKIIFVK